MNPAPATTDALDRLERTLRERDDANERLRQSERAGDAKALELQAQEYERRLETLNHEAVRINTVLEQSIPREVFDTYQKSEQTAKELARRELQDWKDQVNEGRAASAASTRTWVVAIGGLVTLVTVALRFWKP